MVRQIVEFRDQRTMGKRTFQLFFGTLVGTTFDIEDGLHSFCRDEGDLFRILALEDCPR